MMVTRRDGVLTNNLKQGSTCTGLISRMVRCTRLERDHPIRERVLTLYNSSLLYIYH